MRVYKYGYAEVCLEYVTMWGMDGWMDGWKADRRCETMSDGDTTTMERGMRVKRMWWW